MREAGPGRSVEAASRQRLRFAFAVTSVMAIIAGWAASASAEPGAHAPRSYRPADRAAVRGSAFGHGAVRAKLPSFAAAARMSRHESGASRPTPTLLTHRGERDKIRAEEGLNQSGKRALEDAAPIEEG